MIRTSATIIVLTVGSIIGGTPTNAQDLTDPLEIIKRADAATRKVTSAKYDVDFSAEGANADRMPSVHVSYTISGYLSGAPKYYRAEGTVKLPGKSEEERFTAGTDNDNYYVVDHAGKIAYEDLDPIVLGQVAGLVQASMMVEFVHDAPFSDEINGQSRKLIGTRNVGGVECYEIHVVYSVQAPEATWCFSKKDFLPRMRVDHFTTATGETGTRTRIIRNLVVDPKIDVSEFSLKLPDGYKKTDDFAPDFLHLRPGGPTR